MTDTNATKVSRISRAPKGGIISPVNHRFYRGGQFLPAAPAEFKPGPAVLMGSVRQVAWASRLRREALAVLDDEVNARRLFLTSPIRSEVAENRAAIRRFLAEKQALMTERSAARVIEARA